MLWVNVTLALPLKPWVRAWVRANVTESECPLSVLVSKLERLDVKSPVEALLPVFDRGQVAIVTDQHKFLGLITRIDLLNYLRRRVQ